MCIILALLPIPIWMSLESLHIRFLSPATTLTSIGEITGLVGMMFFSLDFILSTRLKFLEAYFGGLNRVYLAHHIFGGIAFILILIHPLPLAGVYALESVKSAALFLLPGTDWTINFGIASLFLMMALLILTFFVVIPYQRWKFSHKFLGLAFFLGGIHSFFVSSDISFYPAMFWYMLLFSILGLIAFLYRLFWKLFVKRSIYSVIKVKKLAQNVIEVDLQSVKRPLIFSPGQFVFVSFKDKAISSEMHPFSISSSPAEGMLDITVKAEGDYTRKLLQLHEGVQAFVEGPFGSFRYDVCPNNNQIWIGGGIGIAPFLAMAKTLSDHPTIHVDLYYAMHDESEAVYIEELQSLAALYPNFAVAPFYSAKKGRLSADTIAKASGDITRKDIFLCGPPLMMHSLVTQLKKLGVPKEQLHSEEFSWE